jgi:hypothetical protein
LPCFADRRIGQPQGIAPTDKPVGGRMDVFNLSKSLPVFVVKNWGQPP